MVDQFINKASLLRMEQIEFVEKATNIGRAKRKQQVNDEEDINWSLSDFNKRFIEQKKNEALSIISIQHITSNQAEPQAKCTDLDAYFNCNQSQSLFNEKHFSLQ